MMAGFKTMSDLDLVESILEDDNIEIIHKYGDDRYVQDIEVGLNSILEEYIDYKESDKETKEEKDLMLKHINKLEKMLDRRSVTYKTWEDVQDSM